MTSMWAIRQHEFGGPEVLRYEEIPRPEPIPTEVRVRMLATSVNPVDLKTRAGGATLTDLPFTVGWDVVGVVDELGRGVTRFAVGDEVLGMPWFPRQAASYAQYVTAPSRQLVRKPPVLSIAEAAALPLAGLTAWQTLVQAGELQAGQRVLINGASGGVGHLAVQVAKAQGAHVIGTASAASHDILAGLGADELIDYQTTRFEDATGDIDLFLDLVGGENSIRALAVLRPDGLLISVPSGVSQELRDAAAQAKRRLTDFMVEPDEVGLSAVAALVEAGKLRPVISQEFALADAAGAHKAAEHSHSLGKIVIAVDAA